MSRLRSYAPMKRQSDKVKKGEPDFKAVYAEVDARSDGRCEVWTVPPIPGGARCPRRAVEHHHLFKPRRSNHTPEDIVHACRPCHDRMEWPYKRGRLCYLGTYQGQTYSRRALFTINTAASKFEARGQGA